MKVQDVRIKPSENQGKDFTMTISTAAMNVLDALQFHFFHDGSKHPLNILFFEDYCNQTPDYWREVDNRLQRLSARVHEQRLLAEDYEKRRNRVPKTRHHSTENSTARKQPAIR